MLGNASGTSAVGQVLARSLWGREDRRVARFSQRYTFLESHSPISPFGGLKVGEARAI